MGRTWNHLFWTRKVILRDRNKEFTMRLTVAIWETVESSPTHVAFSTDIVVFARTLSTIDFTDQFFCAVDMTITGKTVGVSMVTSITSGRLKKEIKHKTSFTFQCYESCHTPNYLSNFEILPKMLLQLWPWMRTI